MPADSSMLTVMVVARWPAFGHALSVGLDLKDVPVKSFAAKFSVERLDARVLGLTWPAAIWTSATS